MPSKVIVKGNRCKPLKGCDGETIGFELYTGPEGEELLDASYCSDFRVASYIISDFPGGLEPVEEDRPGCPWDCWYLVHTEEAVGAITPDPPAKSSTKKKRKKKA